MTLFTPEPAVDPRSADGDPSPLPEAAGLRVGWLLAGVITVGVAALVALAFGPASLAIHRVALEVFEPVSSAVN